MQEHAPETHSLENAGWLRAAVLGANDGIVSTASLILGVASANAAHASIVVAGIAGLVAGAMSMAAGEYVSVHSQADSEDAEIERERKELAEDAVGEHRELASIYERRGLSPKLAEEVAAELMAHDALAAHARDELGITRTLRARPLQASIASAAAFSVGAGLPVLAAALSPMNVLMPIVAVASLVFLAALGAISSRTAKAPVLRGTVRVTFWGALAMAITAGIGVMFATPA